MFAFIKLQFEMGNITADEVYSFVPRWITNEQADEITRKNASESQEWRDEINELESGEEAV